MHAVSLPPHAKYDTAWTMDERFDLYFFCIFFARNNRLPIRPLYKNQHLGNLKFYRLFMSINVLCKM
jgi:hypothetical protein